MVPRWTPGDPPPKQRRRTHALTETERRLLQAALRNLRKKFGTWKALAEAMGYSDESLRGIARGVDFGSLAVAERAAKVAGVSVEILLAAKIVSADVCPHCGQPFPK